jgi:hypothetical protein
MCFNICFKVGIHCHIYHNSYCEIYFVLVETDLSSIWKGFVCHRLITLKLYMKLNGFSNYANAAVL